MRIAEIFVSLLLTTVYPIHQNQILFVAEDGCAVNSDSSIFMQEEDTDNPIETWEWKWSSDVTIVPNNVGWPSYKYMPDGHISGVKVCQ